MSKKYRIKIKEQWFDFDSYHEAKLRAMELLHQNCWWFQLETFEEEKVKELERRKVNKKIEVKRGIRKSPKKTP